MPNLNALGGMRSADYLPGDADACTAAGITPLRMCGRSAATSSTSSRTTTFATRSWGWRFSKPRAGVHDGGRGVVVVAPVAAGVLLFTAEEAALRNLFLRADSSSRGSDGGKTWRGRAVLDEPLP